MRSTLVLCVVLFGCCLSCVSAHDDTCYTSGSVAGIVIATVVVTLVSAGLAAAFIWYLWKQRKGEYGDEEGCVEKAIPCPPMSPDKQLIVNNDYAFDNPYFKDDETDHVNTTQKSEPGLHMDNGDITPSQNPKAANGTNGQQKKNRPFSSLPFHAVFHPSGKKQRATTDDTYISKHLERISVPLRGHDFTGLGFNICGNMRDGIFVKDVLHRGPASESGKIKAGDRIVGVTVSFAGMVYEDALTILSYASPYDVKLELEKSPSSANNAANVANLPSSSPKRLGASTSFRNCGQRGLFHPLYRSQSIDDLTQIGKEGFQKEGNSPAINKPQKDPSATPKRSQSVEASNGGPKSRPAVSVKSGDESKSLSSNSKGSRKSSTSSYDSTGKAATPLPEKTQPAPVKEESVKKEIKSSRFRVEPINTKTEAPILPVRQAPPAKPARDNNLEEKHSLENGNVEEKHHDAPQASKEQDGQTKVAPAEAPQVATSAPPTDNLEAEAGEKQPMAPPRKSNGTPAKRRAPAPPPANTTTTETAADVHRADELPVKAESGPEDGSPSCDPPPPPTSQVPDSSDPSSGPPDTSSVADNPQPASQEDEEPPTSPGKRKASSLGDLTTLERGARKTSASTAILERAVSMDLQQQSIPGENLIKQKKILRTPAFEDDYDEIREGDLNDTEGGLKRWDDGLDKVLTGLTNGHMKLDGDIVENITISTTKDEHLEQKIHEMSETIAEISTPPKKVVKLDIDLNLDSSSGSETTLQDIQEPEKLLTSTPSRKLIEVKDFLKDDDVSLDDVPYLASAKQDGDDESSTTKQSVRTTSTPLFSPVTISIPIIKPDMTNYEKLPSPPPASTHPALDPTWRATKISTTVEDPGRYPLERISVQSLYKPIFSSKETGEADDDDLPEVTAITEKLVNGNDSDASENYSTAQESSMETSTLSITMSSPTVGNHVTVKTPNNVAGFAKTLIIPGPNEVESLLSLAGEPNTPPPQLEPPPKPIETE